MSNCGCEGSCPVCRLGEVDNHRCNRCKTIFCPKCHGIKHGCRSENVNPCKCGKGRLQHYYRQGGIPSDKLNVLAEKFNLPGLRAEICFNIETDGPLDPTNDLPKLKWLLSETFEQENFSARSFASSREKVVEVGPNNNFTTPYSTNAVSICRACGIKNVTRIEVSRRYFLPSGADVTDFVTAVFDRMTESPYAKPLETFASNLVPEKMKHIPLKELGVEALKEANKKLGLGMDEQDFQYYMYLFGDVLKRNPTDVELFQLAQANSEHSRHHFFKGQLEIDGEIMPYTLFDIIKAPYLNYPGNSIIAFHDNSSAIKGFNVWTILPQFPGLPSAFTRRHLYYHIIFTAETHNFPSGVAPFPGAETGTGGRIRDIQAVGRGGLIVAGTAAYCVGSLRIPGYDLPWEHLDWLTPPELAKPLQILIRASDGASDYGNKIGEPVIIGFARSNELLDPKGRRRAWFKPIMFTGGIGLMDAKHIKKRTPKKGDIVIILGGPNYRIGMGGGAASSMIQGDNVAALDFNAVQRGDAQMEQKDARVINACIAMGKDSPIVTMHDLGAGGNCNAIPEGVDPLGGKVNLRKLPIGDPTLSPREIWGNESQERYYLVVKKERLAEFIKICQREKCPYAIVGEITGNGKIVVYDPKTKQKVVDLNLKQIFSEVPQKIFSYKTEQQKLPTLKLPEGLTISQALERVLRLLAVGSKRFLTTKVDRSVSGLIAQQQCVGPLQITLADYAMIATSWLEKTGAATSIGERPILELLNPEAMARMATAEALTNLCFAKISHFKDIRFSANWMWAGKVHDEGARLYNAARALSNLLLELNGPVIDGGKDSLSMAAKVKQPDGQTELVKAPGTLVMSAYAPVPDILKKVTPDLKAPGKSKLLFLDLANGKLRLGGSALAQVYEQIGKECPDVVNVPLLKFGFEAVQELISKGLVLAGHDKSDGGLITCLLEMAFAGNCGLDIDFGKKGRTNWIQFLFNEELGLVLEYLPENEKQIKEILSHYNLQKHATIIGKTASREVIALKNNDRNIFSALMTRLRDTWEETSYHLDLQQANPVCVKQEREVNYKRPYGPHYKVEFNPKPTQIKLLNQKIKPKVAIIREEGSNGDREMQAAFYLAGFEPWDATMTDIISGRISLNQFRGVAFVGGFSFADVMDAGKGWAGTIRFNAKALHEFRKFYERSDTFSLGVCNGCQLMALLGWVPWSGIEIAKQPRFIRNLSGRFESRFSAVKIMPSPAIMLKGMEGSVLGIWNAHGEGRFYCPDEGLMKQIKEQKLIPIRFVDDAHYPTTTYPFNPNGSPDGITALCSPDGRHLAMMPHPERAFLPWQWGYWPSDWSNMTVAPWLKLFQNAKIWCEQNS